MPIHTHDNRGSRGNANLCTEILDKMRMAVSGAITSPLTDVLGEIPEVGSRPLHIIAHHTLTSLPVNVSLTGDGVDPLIEHFEISYSPSLLTSKRCLFTELDPLTSLAAIYVEPDVSDEHALHFAPIEVEVACRWVESSREICIGQQVPSETEIIERIDGARIWHFSAHGKFNADDPKKSRIDLGETQVSLGALFDRQALSPPDFVILSACDTALVSTNELPHELLSLPTAFLQLGARGVVATQWPVSDFATTFLMCELYERFLGEQVPLSNALRRAQFWLRDMTPDQAKRIVEKWETAGRMTSESAAKLVGDTRITNAPADEKIFKHPMYWGAFTYFGV